MPSARPRGFTLIETVAAVVILAVAIPPMLWAVSEAHMQRANPLLASRARWLVIEKFEDVVADRHGLGFIAGLPPGVTPETPIAGFPAYNRTVTISLEHGPWDNDGQVWLIPAGGYKTITVAVDWTDAGGDARTLSISTVVTDYP